ncbi:prepilin-type N-terminal cleavage/methylation domain-containing protein [Candidatus Daviesbacteria bacterium]|nr:prepilin-type N-terminal cleavage/methylation domain-containing protein [Candidatus Daviesbacteria bacterium]
MKKSAQVLHKGFTLVELLVVIAIIAILAAVVVLIINPLELTRRSKDAARLTDLANLQQAINVVMQEVAGGTNVACNGAVGSPATCRDDSTGVDAAAIAAKRVIVGTGWVRVNLSAQTSVTVPTLPIDPVNDATYHYTYCGSGDNWEIFTELESNQQIPKMANDGGLLNDTATLHAAKYEVGSVLNLTSQAFCTY